MDELSLSSIVLSNFSGCSDRLPCSNPLILPIVSDLSHFSFHVLQKNPYLASISSVLWHFKNVFMELGTNKFVDVLARIGAHNLVHIKDFAS
jgi:hypothetical protein